MVKIPNRDILSPSVENKELKDYLILLEEREKFLVDSLCGPEYNREHYPYWRYKTRPRTIYTRFGKIERRFAYIKSESGAPFCPLLEWLGVPKNQHISSELKLILADKPSKMTYARSAEDVRNSFNFTLSRMTLHAYVKETSSLVTVEQQPDPHHLVLLADGTKVNGPGLKHEVRSIVSLGENSSDKQLLKQAINKSWKEMVQDLDISQYRVFVGDGEPGLASTFCKGNIKFHFCHEHAKRDLAFFLWKDGLGKKKYQQHVSVFEGILNCLQNSTAKHKKDKDWERLLWRIKWAKKEINTLAVELSCRELHQAAAFLMRNKDYLTTAAEMCVLGITVPWTTNVIERIMQEVGIRTKKKGMYWSEEGLERILKIVLKRYFLPKERRYYKEIFAATQKEAVKS